MEKPNDLLFGKQSQERIVSIEVNDSEAELFIQEPDGSITSKTVPNKYWILSHEPREGWHKLKGDLHYKYGKQFSKRWEFEATRRKLKDSDIYSIWEPREAFQVKDGYTLFRGLNPKDVSILSFDLETTTKDPTDPKAQILLISCTYRNKDQYSRHLFAYDDYSSQGAMIEAFCGWVREKDPSIITGHWVLGFDMEYLATIAEREEVELLLGRDGSAMRIERHKEPATFEIDGSRSLDYYKKWIYGRQIVDTLFLSYKHDIVAKKYESHGLKPIIKAEGLESANRTFYDASQIRFNYQNPTEWDKIKEYCKDDADDALKLFDLMAPPYFYMAQNIPKPFQVIIWSRTGSPLNSILSRAYLQQGHSLPKATPAKKYEGAISLGNPGCYKNVKKWDVTSLYPSIMLQYKVYDQDKDPQAYFLQMLETFTKERIKNKKKYKETKDKYYDDLQNAQKVLINSCYGFMGTPGLNFNSPDKAEFVTLKGREILTQAIKWSESKNMILVNADTDSISACKSDMGPFSSEENKALLENLNEQFPELINFEPDGPGGSDEPYPKVVVFAAKNYALYDGKKIKTKGSSIRDPKREPALKEFIDKVIDSLIHDRNDFQEIYNGYAKEILNICDIKRWQTKKTISDKVLNPKRTNEQKILEAIQGTEYSEGDKVYLYYDSRNDLKLVDRWDGDYSKTKYLKRLYDTALIFETVINKDLFLNYSLVRNNKLWDNIK